MRRKALAWTRGEPAEFKSSERAVRGFCGRCGTPLFFRYLDSNWIDVTIGSLDDPGAIAPRLNYGVESKVAWFESITALPERETEPGGLTGKDSIKP